MKIISFGCSFVFGTDLADQTNQDRWPLFSHMTWPALVAKNLDVGYWSRARGASGNLCILNRVLDAIYIWPRDFFVISWTFIDRFDYSDPFGSHFNGSNKDYNTLLPSEDADDLGQFYFKHLHSEHKDKLTALMYIKTAIDLLKDAGIPFVMTCADDLLFCRKWHAAPPVILLQEYVKPYIHNFEGRNFTDWSRHKGFEISPSGHPLSEAHTAAADLMTPIIDTILRKA